MAELMEWQTYPLAGSPEAAASTGAATGQMPWQSYPLAPPEPPAAQPKAPPSIVGSIGEAPIFANPEDQEAFNRNQAEAGGALLRGATLGLSDKAQAATGAITDLIKGNDSGFSDLYHKHLADIRERAKQFGEESPAQNVLMQGTGMVATAPLVPEGRAVTTLGKIGEGLLTGGAVGGIAGFGATNDESVGKDIAGTAAGAATGAATGGVLAGVGDRVVKPVIDWVARRYSPEAAESQAVKTIAKRMQQDASAGGPTAQDMLDLMIAAPDKPQSLADISGENVRGLAGRISRAPGEGRQIATQFLNQRDVGAGTRLAGDVDEALHGGNAYGANEALMQARSEAGRDAYAPVWGLQGIWNPRLQQFVDDPVMRQGLRRGMEMERLDSVTQGRPFDPTQMGVDLDQDGNVTLRSVPNMRVLDAGKRGLDAMIADERNPITGRLSQRGVSLDQFRRAYLGQIDSLDTNGVYAAARNAWAGPSASMDALRAGQGVFSKGPDEIASEFARLPDNNQEFYRLGAADAIKERLARTGMGGDEAKRIIGNDYTQAQLRPLFRSQDDYDRFINSATAENRMFETRRSLIGGSDTARRLAEDNQESGAVGHAVRGAAALMEGAPVAATLSGLKAIGALTGGESPQVNAAAARLLFNPEPIANLQTLSRVLDAQNARQAPRLVSTPLAALIARSYPSLAATPLLRGPSSGP